MAKKYYRKFQSLSGVHERRQTDDRRISDSKDPNVTYSFSGKYRPMNVDGISSANRAMLP